MDRNTVKSVHALAEKIAAKKSMWIVLYALICTLLLPTYISDATTTISNGIVPAIFFAGAIMLLNKYYHAQHNRREKVLTHILGTMLSCMIALGRAMTQFGEVALSDLGMIASIVLYAHLIAAVLFFLWEALGRAEEALYKDSFSSSLIEKLSRAVGWLMEHPLCIAVLLLLCWLPCYISSFPGGFRYDANVELSQLTNGYRGSFPMLHSMIITALLPACNQWLGSYNAGVVIYVVVQMLLFAAMYTHMLMTFYKRKASRLLLGVMLLYCALFPVIPMLVTQTVRDVLFSGLLTYTCFLFYLLASDKKAFFRSVGKPILLGVMVVLTMLSRSNLIGVSGVVVIALISAAIWLFSWKTSARGAVAFAAAALSSFMALSLILSSYCRPYTPAPLQDSLSVVTQTITRAYTGPYATETTQWTKEEEAQFHHYFTLGLYIPENADPTKCALNPDVDMGEFLKFWAKMGTKFPGAYVDGWLALTMKMWYPNSIVDGYNQYTHPDWAAYDKCYYAFHVPSLEKPATFMGQWPAVYDFYERIGVYISFEKIPLVSLLFSIGFQFWILLNCMFYALYRKSSHLYPSIAILLGYVLISSFVPLVLLRYFAALFFAFPLTMLFTLQPGVGRAESEAAEGSEA